MMMCKRSVLCSVIRRLHYVQGQSPEPKIREYFYYIDHQGQLFLDDVKIKNFTSCFKDKKFLQFFFNRVERNATSRYAVDFPYISLCGRERNYIRCDDVPIVFTQILPNDVNPTPKLPRPAEISSDSDGHSPASDRLSYCMAGELLVVPMSPEDVCMVPSSGRVYHTGPERAGGVGLIKSSLAIELSKNFEFRDGEGAPPTHLTWRDRTYSLNNVVLKKLEFLKSA